MAVTMLSAPLIAESLLRVQGSDLRRSGEAHTTGTPLVDRCPLSEAARLTASGRPGTVVELETGPSRDDDMRLQPRARDLANPAGKRLSSPPKRPLGSALTVRPDRP